MVSRPRKSTIRSMPEAMNIMPMQEKRISA